MASETIFSVGNRSARFAVALYGACRALKPMNLEERQPDHLAGVVVSDAPDVDAADERRLDVPEPRGHPPQLRRPMRHAPPRRL